MEKLTEDDVEFFSIAGRKTGKVVDVYDGDTIHVITFLEGKYVKLKARIIGIDTPEIKLPKNCENREEKKNKAKLARNYLVSQITNCGIDINLPYTSKEMKELLRTNTLLVEIDFFEFDKYGRILIDIENVSKKMIKGGYANSYDGGTKNTEFELYQKI